MNEIFKKIQFFEAEIARLERRVIRLEEGAIEHTSAYPTTTDEVKDAGARIGLIIDEREAEDFLAYWIPRGWCFGNGRGGKIQNWDGLFLKQFISRGRQWKRDEERSSSRAYAEKGVPIRPSCDYSQTVDHSKELFGDV